MYTQEEFKTATPISNTEYCKMDNLRFEGQTRMDMNGDYKMYWSHNDKLYVTSHNLMN